jgi:hypothetical protein
MKDPLSDLVGYALRRASSAMMEDMAKRMGALGLRTSEASVLMLIRANPGITQSDLCRALGIQRANMAPLIARMEARKLVARSRSDGRSFGLAVTEAVKRWLLRPPRVRRAGFRPAVCRSPSASRALAPRFVRPVAQAIKALRASKAASDW